MGVELDATKHGLFVWSNAEQDKSPLARFYQADSGSSAGVFHIDQQGMGDTVFLDVGGNATAFVIDSEAANATGVDWDFQNDTNNLFQISVNNAEKFAIDWQGYATFANAYTLPIVDGALNEVLTTDGIGGVTWQAGGGGGGDLDDAYELGSTVTVDVADLTWDLVSTQDFHIKIDGNNAHQWFNTGEYQIDSPSDLAETIDINQIYDGVAGIISNFNVDLSFPSTSSFPVDPFLLRGGWIQVTNDGWLKPPLFGGNAAYVRGWQIDAVHTGNISDAQFIPSAQIASSTGLYGGSGITLLTDDSTQNVAGESFGLWFNTNNRPTINKGGGTYTANNQAVRIMATTDPVITAGNFVANTYAINATVSGTAEGGSQTAYGIYAVVSGANSNYGAHYTIPDDGQTGIEILVNANQANADANLMDFRSATGSEGTIHLAAGGVVTYNAFTGGHYTNILGDTKDLVVGTVLEVVDGDVMFPTEFRAYEEVVYADEYGTAKKDSEGNIMTNWVVESVGASPSKPQLFPTRISTTEGSTAAVGVYGGDDGMGRDFVWGLGTGFIRVSNEGKNLQIGDYLMSSDKRGLAELQGNGIYQNITIAKVTESVIWQIGEKERLIRCILLGG